MRWKSFLIIGLLGCAVTAKAQGTFLYTWHGDSNYFQASFQVTPEENQPGQYFEGGLFKSTFSVVSPDDFFPVAGGSFSGDDGSGFGPPLTLDVMMTDPYTGMGIDVFGGGTGYYLINEYRLSDHHQVWVESGYWTSAPVPEPSMLSLFVLVGVALAARAGFSTGTGR